MRLFVTIFEDSCESAVAAIEALPPDHDGVEVRAERFAAVDLRALRAATKKPIILTYRGGKVPDLSAALESGIELVDVEWHEGLTIERHHERIVVSHHDYDAIRDVERIVASMQALGCAQVKLAATPRNFAENERLLRLLDGRPGMTVIGMGERGLYSRILAPFAGSELTFVAAGQLAAPGQLTLERALDIYGPERARLHAEKVFAVVGNPAGHSLSPSIHNRLFREKRAAAAYTIASIERFEEITGAFLGGRPCGLSVTTPFKDDAFAFAQRIGAELGANARRARAVNTLVNLGGRILAENTDVDGFARLLPRARKAAILGGGGTARAARVALEDAGIPATVFNRTVAKGDAPLEALADFDGELIVNTLPASVEVALPRCDVYIEAAYGGGARRVEAQTRIGGLELLQAQAVRQHELFMKAIAEGN